MKALALETSTLRASVAIVAFEGTEFDIMAESNMPAGETHSKTLLPEIQRLLDLTGFKVQDFDFLSASIGPGSFTGLRIGLSAAKGLAWAAKKPLVGAPSLDALAMSAPLGDHRICPLIDARKGQVYTAFYTRDADDQSGRAIHRQTDYRACTIEEVVSEIKAKTTFFGDGAQKYNDDLAAALGPLYIRGPEELDFPRAVFTALAGFNLFKKGAETNPAQIIPLYIRPPDIRKPKPKTA